MCFLCAYKSIDVISFAYLYTHSKYCNKHRSGARPAAVMPTSKCLDRSMIDLSERQWLHCACAETSGSRDDEGAANDDGGG
jgi:hypothetical protein